MGPIGLLWKLPYWRGTPSVVHHCAPKWRVPVLCFSKFPELTIQRYRSSPQVHQESALKEPKRCFTKSQLSRTASQQTKSFSPSRRVNATTALKKEMEAPINNLWSLYSHMANMVF